MGATTILPGSHYYTSLAGVDLGGEFPICVDAGTIVLTNYDMWHAATPNTSSRKRAMVAFLFARMSEPQGPTWDCADQAWNPGPDAAHPEDGDGRPDASRPAPALGRSDPSCRSCGLRPFSTVRRSCGNLATCRL